MTKEQIEEILNRVRTWPADRQEVAANILLGMEASDIEPLDMTPEEVAQVVEVSHYVNLAQLDTEAEVRTVFKRYS